MEYALNAGYYKGQPNIFKVRFYGTVPYGRYVTTNSQVANENFVSVFWDVDPLYEHPYGSDTNGSGSNAVNGSSSSSITPGAYDVVFSDSFDVILQDFVFKDMDYLDEHIANHSDSTTINNGWATDANSAPINYNNDDASGSRTRTDTNTLNNAMYNDYNPVVANVESRVYMFEHTYGRVDYTETIDVVETQSDRFSGMVGTNTLNEIWESEYDFSLRIYEKGFLLQTKSIKTATASDSKSVVTNYYDDVLSNVSPFPYPYCPGFVNTDCCNYSSNYNSSGDTVTQSSTKTTHCYGTKYMYPMDLFFSKLFEARYGRPLDFSYYWDMANNFIPTVEIIKPINKPYTHSYLSFTGDTHLKNYRYDSLAQYSFALSANDKWAIMYEVRDYSGDPRDFTGVGVFIANQFYDFSKASDLDKLKLKNVSPSSIKIYDCKGV